MSSSRTGTSLTQYLRDRGFDVFYQEMNNRFTDGDFDSQSEFYKDRSIYILGQKTPKKPSDELLGKILAIGKAAKDCEAKRITAIAPSELYGRAEKGQAENPGDPNLQGRGNMVDMVAACFNAVGIEQYLTVDSHNEAASRASFIRHYGKNTFHSIDPAYYLNSYLMYHSTVDFTLDEGGNIVLVIPDSGGKARVQKVYDLMREQFPNISTLQVKKTRLVANDASQLVLKLEDKSENFDTLEQKTAIWIDDVGETFGTMSENDNLLRSNGELGIPNKKVCYITAPSFCMYHKNWHTRHMESLQRLMGVDFDEIITTNTLEYFTYVLNIERGMQDSSLQIVDEMRSFTEEQRKMYHELQKKLTILDITPAIGKSIIYMESQDKIGEDFSINDAFIDPSRGDEKVAPYLVLRSHNFRDFRIRNYKKRHR